VQRAAERKERAAKKAAAKKAAAEKRRVRIQTLSKEKQIKQLKRYWGKDFDTERAAKDPTYFKQRLDAMVANPKSGMVSQRRTARRGTSGGGSPAGKPLNEKDRKYLRETRALMRTQTWKANKKRIGEEVADLVWKQGLDPKGKKGRKELRRLLKLKKKAFDRDLKETGIKDPTKMEFIYNPDTKTAREVPKPKPETKPTKAPKLSRKQRRALKKQGNLKPLSYDPEKHAPDPRKRFKLTQARIIRDAPYQYSRTLPLDQIPKITPAPKLDGKPQEGPLKPVSPPPTKPVVAPAPATPKGQAKPLPRRRSRATMPMVRSPRQFIDRAITPAPAPKLSSPAPQGPLKPVSPPQAQPVVAPVPKGTLPVKKSNWDEFDLFKGKLSAEERADIPKKDFAIPSKADDAEEKKERGNYPIPDIEHARLALAMVAKHGSPSKQAMVRAAVYEKYPELDKRKEDLDKSHWDAFDLEKGMGLATTVGTSAAKAVAKQAMKPAPIKWGPQKPLDPSSWKTAPRVEIQKMSPKSGKSYFQLRYGDDPDNLGDPINFKTGREAHKYSSLIQRTVPKRTTPRVSGAATPPIKKSLTFSGVEAMSDSNWDIFDLSKGMGMPSQPEGREEPEEREEKKKAEPNPNEMLERHMSEKDEPPVQKSMDPVLAARMHQVAITRRGANVSPQAASVGAFNNTIAKSFAPSPTPYVEDMVKAAPVAKASPQPMSRDRFKELTRSKGGREEMKIPGAPQDSKETKAMQAKMKGGSKAAPKKTGTGILDAIQAGIKDLKDAEKDAPKFKPLTRKSPSKHPMEDVFGTKPEKAGEFAGTSIKPGGSMSRVATNPRPPVKK
tara:strand:- start:1715 stop:4225 length:2511 start_codon:yes stop_codon:yes gene_type:complete